MKLYKIKRGDTFKIKPSKLVSDSGLDTPLAGYTIACQVRDAKDVLIVDIPITLSTYSFESSAVDTSPWPVVDLYCDIQFTKDGMSISSDTFTIRVEKGITQP